MSLIRMLINEIQKRKRGKYTDGANVIVVVVVVVVVNVRIFPDNECGL